MLTEVRWNELVSRFVADRTEQRPLPAPNRNYSKIKRWQIPLLLACLVVKTIAVFYALWMLVILIHELGHLVIGLILQDNFSSFALGSLNLIDSS